jgi:phosphoribosylaminoimidazolecarboxamide formyltransferase / IMP cyclohydrolase
MAKRALLSVTDKTGLIDFGRGLVERGFELVSTGGTAKALRQAGMDVVDVGDVTGFPEIMGGRVKTLHPKVHGGLLGDLRQDLHRAAMQEHGIEPIAVACVNLYAFERTVAAEHTFDDAIESIDVGGPAMIRAAAKNWASVAVVVDPADYPRVLEAIDAGALADLRLALSAKAFRHTAFYDSMISRYLTQRAGEDELSETLTVGMRRAQTFRYGENPHQSGALYRDPLALPGIAQAEQLWGKELSYNNLSDADGAWELVADLPERACAIIKHGNPCGAAAAGDAAESYRQARAADPISAFGGIAAFHGPIDEGAALAMTEKGNFLEVVVATEFSEEAARVFRDRSGWGKDVRLLKAPLPPKGTSLSIKSIRGGAVVQETDEDPGNEWRVATRARPTQDQMAALRLQWAIVAHVKSNAIVVGTSTRLLGVGAGQMNRVQSVRLALEQAGDEARGAILASDAFFPFPDSILVAAKAGIAAIVQPGGSKKDADVVAAADQHGIAMCLTGVRHFRH